MICLHHNDADGKCAGAIVRHCSGDEVELIEMDYGTSIPWEKINAAPTVIIADFSLPKEAMKEIYRQKGENFIWIDHHISAIEGLAELDSIPGLRDLDSAACVLTWDYFFPDYEVPAAVRFIGDRDLWRFEFPQTRAFCEGLNSEDTSADNDQLWTALFNNDEALIRQCLDKGEILLEAHQSQVARWVNARGFEAEFCGYRVMAVNLPGNGDIGHFICRQGYDIAYVYSDTFQDGQIITGVTLYSETVDVSEPAKKYGGGGHKGAAGFRFVRSGNLPFPVEPKC